jgi:hypothetical protein
MRASITDKPVFDLDKGHLWKKSKVQWYWQCLKCGVLADSHLCRGHSWENKPGEESLCPGYVKHTPI